MSPVTATVTLQKLRDTLGAYVRGREELLAEEKKLRDQLDACRTNIAATGGAIQALDRLVTEAETAKENENSPLRAPASSSISPPLSAAPLAPNSELRSPNSGAAAPAPPAP